MVLIFDLDDTLFEEMDYVKSGLRAVACFGQNAYGWDVNNSYIFMYSYLKTHGRGKVFDEWLNSHNYLSKSNVARCLSIYRQHNPKILLPSSTFQLLSFCKNKLPLYLVTDGNKVVQKKKIDALGIEGIFNHCFITHRFGIRHSKPSLYCFEKIRLMEKCEWSDMVYIGDNPYKDFINLNLKGAVTVRVLTGAHANVIASSGYDALHSIKNLSELPAVLSMIKCFREIDSDLGLGKT